MGESLRLRIPPPPAASVQAWDMNTATGAANEAGACPTFDSRSERSIPCSVNQQDLRRQQIESHHRACVEIVLAAALAELIQLYSASGVAREGIAAAVRRKATVAKLKVRSIGARCVDGVHCSVHFSAVLTRRHADPDCRGGGTSGCLVRLEACRAERSQQRRIASATYSPDEQDASWMVECGSIVNGGSDVTVRECSSCHSPLRIFMMIAPSSL